MQQDQYAIVCWHNAQDAPLVVPADDILEYSQRNKLTPCDMPLWVSNLEAVFNINEGRHSAPLQKCCGTLCLLECWNQSQCC
jgi:hypothetical protein